MSLMYLEDYLGKVYISFNVNLNWNKLLFVNTKVDGISGFRSHTRWLIDCLISWLEQKFQLIEGLAS